MGSPIPNADVRALVVLVSGSPGSGKTTLARTLADRLRVLHVSKDSIAMGLAITDPSLPPADVNEIGWDLFWSTVESLAGRGVTLVAEQTMWRGRCEAPVRDRLLPVARVVNVHLRAADALARWESKMRADSLLEGAALERHIADTYRRRDEFDGPLDFGCPRIEIDTSDGYRPSVDDVVEQLRASS